MDAETNVAVSAFITDLLPNAIHAMNVVRIHEDEVANADLELVHSMQNVLLVDLLLLLLLGNYGIIILRVDAVSLDAQARLFSSILVGERMSCGIAELGS